MSDYYDKEMLHVEKERNRLLERIADKLDYIRDEMATTRTMLKSVPLNRLLVPVVDDAKNSNSPIVVRPTKANRPIDCAGFAQAFREFIDNANGLENKGSDLTFKCERPGEKEKNE